MLLRMPYSKPLAVTCAVAFFPVRGFTFDVQPSRLVWKNYSGGATRRWKNWRYV